MDHVSSALVARITRIAVALAIVVGLVPPLGYFAAGYQERQKHAQGDAAVVMAAVARLVESNPEFWRYTTHLDDIVLRSVPNADDERILRLIDTGGATISSLGPALPWPTIRAVVPLYDAGRAVASVEVVLGLRRLVFETCLVLILGAILAGGIFAALRLLPLRALQQTLDQLRSARSEAVGKAAAMSLLSEFSQLMLASRHLKEAYESIPRFIQRMFPGSSGRLYAMSESGKLLESKCSWGTPSLAAEVMGHEDCWGLRRGSSHVMSDPQRDMACPHQKGLATATQYICAPLTAQNEGLGLLYIEPGIQGAPIDPAISLLADTAAEQLALGLANLRMRELLRNQSIRDALTGLHNRRYLEESAERELERSQRKGGGLAVLMIDVDHFKKYNDCNGHEAGDEVLRAIGALMRSTVRASDVACRYGGEEFTVLMPEASAAVAMQRAEQLRQATHALRIGALPPVTLSIGVAVTPDHGSEWEVILRAADTALYSAKRGGRDRVQLAKLPAPLLAIVS